MKTAIIFLCSHDIPVSRRESERSEMMMMMPVKNENENKLQCNIFPLRITSSHVRWKCEKIVGFSPLNVLCCRVVLLVCSGCSKKMNGKSHRFIQIASLLSRFSCWICSLCVRCEDWGKVLWKLKNCVFFLHFAFDINAENFQQVESGFSQQFSSALRELKYTNFIFHS